MAASLRLYKPLIQLHRRSSTVNYCSVCQYTTWRYIVSDSKQRYRSITTRDMAGGSASL